MDPKTKRMVISYARRISQSWAPRNIAKDKAKIAPALHRCDKCGNMCYEGESENNYQKYLDQFPDKIILFEPIHMDHIKPVVDINGWTTWEDFFESLFCPEDNFRALCPPCHEIKTSNENSHRPNFKFKRKIAVKRKGKE